ncbi:HIRAN domain-containing protein [uncultured Thiodictyon sp.]|jgi:hypothetical protein|uniref:HIRAN domain-containing protein n=1 Tax=uncultured Thiodictyon sp. TaxID=1846217 RepID=UPI0025D87C7B|nr:HIRAN domain-containing protein [uncultured Thiodictyon sp.]
MKRLFLIWHDPESSRWLPVGQLSRDRDDYRFVYTKGAEESENFLPFGRMTNLHAVYVAKELFPLFSNRLMPRSRPEYRDFLTKDFQNPSDPSALLVRTGEPLSIVGYCPRFYSAEFSKLIDLVGGDRVVVAVSAVNLDAPLQFRLRCRLTAPWPAGFTACSQDAFQPLG